MNEDIRLSTTFFSHRKTKKLQRALGADGIVCLLQLWTRVAIEKNSGVLSGWDEDDIEIEAGFSGEPGEFVEALLNIGFLDKDESYSLHNWEDRQEWVVNAQERSAKARLSRMAQTHKDIYKRLVNEGCTGVTKEQYKELTKVRHPENEGITPNRSRANEPLTIVNATLAPNLTSSSSLPALKDKDVKFASELDEPVSAEPQGSQKGKSVEPDRARSVFEYWKEQMNHQRAKLDNKRRKKVNDRFKDGYSVDDLKSAVDGCRASPYHMGENDSAAVYDDLELICRDGSHVDKFIKLANMSQGRGALSPAGRKTANAAAEWMKEQEEREETVNA